MNQPENEGAIPRVGAFQAKTELSRLLRQARAGKRFVITQHGKPVAELIPFQEPAPHVGWGDMEGEITYAEDWDAPLEDFQEYMDP